MEQERGSRSLAAGLSLQGFGRGSREACSTLVTSADSAVYSLYTYQLTEDAARRMPEVRIDFARVLRDWLRDIKFAQLRQHP
jgi:hypothetical protein